jgi:hypothetical protein
LETPHQSAAHHTVMARNENLHASGVSARPGKLAICDSRLARDRS